MALLYHGTDAEFDGFSDAAPGTREGSANNSALGIWFFADRRHAENFGARTLEADVELGRSWRLPLSEFVRLDREAEEPGKPARPGLSKPAAGKDRFPARPAKATDRFPRRTPRLPGPRRANERLVGRAVSDKPVSPVPLGKPMKKTMRHPLGDQAGTDE